MTKTGSWTVVIAFHNRPLALWWTLMRFSARGRLGARFVIIDNGSSLINSILAKFVAWLSLASWSLERRPNSGREAGAYWHAIRSCALNSDGIVFIQDQIHRRGTVPSGVPKFFSPYNSRFHPYYSGRLRTGEFDLVQLNKVLMLYPDGLIGLGGRRCAHGIEADARFTTGPWPAKTNSLGAEYFDFFSGACFAVGRSGLALLESHESLADNETEKWFAHYWERAWGTIFTASSRPLIDFHSSDPDVYHSVGVSSDQNGPWWQANYAARLSKNFVRDRLSRPSGSP